jgi:predicted Zn finger-like uncharacterized protein
MPVTIACPKCQTKYKLPDSALGKPVKCKTCAAVFRTPAPGTPAAGSKTPVAPRQPQSTKPQPSAQELAKLGIDGPLKRQADVFAGTAPPPPQQGNPLGNFVVDDPGFADLNTVRQEVENESSEDDGMASILNNPYAMSAGKSGRRKASDVDFSPYNIARIGMWMVYVSWVALLIISVLMYLFSWIGRLAPGFVASVAQTIGATALAGLLFTIGGIALLSLVAVFIGQIICIFAPNKDERIYASLAVGSLVASLVFPLVGVFMGAFAAEATDAGQTTRAAIGFMFLILFGLSYILLLSNMFFFIAYFKRIGKNVNAKAVVEAANFAMLTWIAAIVVGIICLIASIVLVAVAGPKPGSPPPDWFNLAINIIGLINVILSFAVIGTLIAMVRSALQKTRAKTA